MRYFTYDGVSSIDFGIYVDSVEIYKSAARSISEITVPGRNGTLTYDENRFENVSITENCYIKEGAPANLKKLQEHLLSSTGYRRLEDSYDPEFYRMARYVSETGFDILSIRHISGTFSLPFDCMPQRFFKTGEEITTLSSGSLTLLNPSKFTAKPLIRVYGYGALEVGGNQITITSGSNFYIDIDSEIERCYEGSEARDSLVSLTDHKYPVFDAGSTTVKISGNITKVEITPRWWTI